MDMDIADATANPATSSGAPGGIGATVDSAASVSADATAVSAKAAKT